MSLNTVLAAESSDNKDGKLSRPQNPLPFTYESNGATRREVRDPCIIREGDTYYMTFTMWPFANREENRLNLSDNGSSPGIQLFSSKDLKNWKAENWLVKSSDLPENSPYKHRFWAPEIHKIGGKFYLIFTADNWLKPEYNPAGNWGSAGYAFVGVADKITGPYQHITYIPGGACDTTLFGDSDGKIYAVMPKYHMFIRPIDLSQLDKGEIKWLGPEQKILDCKNDDIGLPTSPDYLEGPWMEKIGDKYFLFNAQIYKDKNFPQFFGYRTGVAYADNPLGPWKKDARGPVFYGGHLAVFDGPDGGKWFSYRIEDDDKTRGLLAVDPFVVDADGKVQSGGPSQTPVAIAATSDAAWKTANGPLMTPWAKEVSPQNALPEYPRPTMARAQWQNLNGLWDYAITEKNATRPQNFDGQILVPYPLESALSGVMKPLLPEHKLWYRRNFTLPAAWSQQNQKVLLHFGAVDWESAVFLNGKSLGTHRGGYDSFTFDITKNLKTDGANELVVAVCDPTDSSWQMRGKQTLHPGGAAYTATSGLWQTVWIEPVSQSSIESLKMVPDAKLQSLHLTVNGRTPPGATNIEVSISDGKNTVATAKGILGGELNAGIIENLAWYKATSVFVTTEIEIPLPNVHLWTPDDPFLYDLNVQLKDQNGQTLDAVRSYFGMRSLAVGHDEKGNTRLLFNGKPMMLPGALDQGFWPDGIYTAPTDAALRFDVEAAKKLGLAAVRKHIKIEPERYYYWCDKLGLLVLQDLPSGYASDPFTDAPTHPEGALHNEMEMRTLIGQRWNHPSIICWVMFNEGWGQHDTLRYARWAKELDPSRLIDEASGFPRHGGGDVLDVHGGIPPKEAKRISLDSETLGNGLAVPGHAWPGKPWATGTYDPQSGGETKSAFPELYALDADSKLWYTRQIKNFYRAMWATKDQTGSSGDFKVQLYDVESETNGFLSYDRAVWKVEPEIIARAARGEGLRADVVELLPTSMTNPLTWRYTTSQPANNWTTPDFDDTKWQQGKAGFGAAVANGKSNTNWNSSDLWLRTTFDLKTKPVLPMLRLVHDEDVQVYINGVLAMREGGFTTAYDDYEIDAKAAATLKAGTNTIAVHVQQTIGGQGVDVGLIEATKTK